MMAKHRCPHCNNFFDDGPTEKKEESPNKCRSSSGSCELEWSRTIGRYVCIVCQRIAKPDEVHTHLKSK